MSGFRSLRHGWALAGTIVLAVLAFGGVTSLLLVFDHRVTAADAVRTGGLAAGAFVALYALWLNDRRRQVEESRYELARRSNDQDRERVADERFARAVELLGHEADQVRVGALHAMSGLARNRPGYTQTVLDVLCSYLRCPFEHADYAGDGDRLDRTPHRDDGADRERQVRLTAQRLIRALLPDHHEQPGSFPDLDLTGAVLDYLDLSGKGIDTLVLRDAQLYGVTRLGDTRIEGNVWFTRTVSHGRLHCDYAEFHGKVGFHYFTGSDHVTFGCAHFHQGAAFLSARFHGPVTLLNAVFDKSLDLRQTVFAGDLDLRASLPSPVRPGVGGMTVDTSREVQLPTGWVVQPDSDGHTGRIRTSAAPE